MERKRLSKELTEKSSFVVVAELTGGPGFDFAPIDKFLKNYAEAGDSSIPSGFDFVGITATQNPGGAANIEPADELSHLRLKNLLGNLDFVPHISCKDQNADAITSSLAGFKDAGIECVLALTGDKPIKAKGVFELDSIGLLQLIAARNNQYYAKSRPEDLDNVYQCFAGAAVSPFKYTEASQMQQYYKMEKKITAGAKFLITQVGWDWKKSVELFTYLEKNDLDIPVIGNVYLLSTTTPAPRLMHDIKLPGCFVSDELLEKLYSESFDDHIERAAQQVAMYKAIGAAGVDIGGAHDFEVFARVLKRAGQIGADWVDFKDNLCWPAENPFYLYDKKGKEIILSNTSRKMNQRFFDLMHRMLLDPQHRGFGLFKKTMAALGTEKQEGFFYKLFNASEKSIKYLLFDCQECGDCFLPENFGLCTIGGCEKGMQNAPCGDSTVDGHCGNNLERVCVGELIYQAAAAKVGGRDKLRATVNPPRDTSLEHSSSILNYLFAKDHTRRNVVISIGESIHASIPKTGKVMKMLSELGPDAYTKPSGPLNYIQALIESQIADGADYIALNVDAFGESDPQQAVDMMVEYVKLVTKWGRGVAVCIDSSDDNVLIAGLKQWYQGGDRVRQPLINSIKDHTMDKMFPLKRQYDFSFIGLLVSQEKAAGAGGVHSVDELHALARRIFDRAIEVGFQPGEIYFDSTVFPLAIDMPMSPGVAGYTYRAFETIKKIKTDPVMKGVHCSLGVSNSVRDLPGRKVGVMRAYLAKAMEYGLDTAIINVAHHFGQVEPAPELVRLVDAYARMDGSPERLNEAMNLMGQFCQRQRG